MSNSQESTGKMLNDNNVMIDDVVGQRYKGEYRFGAVIQSHTEEEEDCNLDVGYILVEWYPEGTGVDLHQSEVEILDRALLPRDIVYKNHDQLGTVLHTHRKADFVIVGTNSKLTKIDVSKVEPITRLIGQEIVSYGPWLGQGSDVFRNVYVMSTHGVMGCISESLLLHMVELHMVRDQYPHNSDKGGYEGIPHGSSIFYPGQALSVPFSAVKFFSWAKKDFPYTIKNEYLYVTVQWVTMSSVRVRWKQAAGGFNYQDQTGEVTAEKLQLTDPTQQPDRIINQDKMKWLHGVNHFRECCRTLGHRFVYELTPEDCAELNKPLKKRKRKMHKPRKHLERKQRKKMAGSSSSGIKRRSGRPPKQSEETSSDEYEDIKETPLVISPSFNTTKEAGTQVDDESTEKQPESKTTETNDTDNNKTTTESAQTETNTTEATENNTAATKDDPVANLTSDKQRSKRLVEEIFNLVKEEEKSSKNEKWDYETSNDVDASFSVKTKNLSVYGVKVSNYRTVLRIEVKEFAEGIAEEIREIIKSKAPTFDIKQSTVENYIKSARRSDDSENSFIVTMEKSRKNGNMCVSRYQLPDMSNMEEVIEKSKNVRPQGASKAPYFPGQKVTVEMAMSHTTARVMWQDGTIDENVPSVQLTPTESLNENDFFPSDFVSDTRPSDGGVDLFKYGVVQKVFSKKRKAVVRWFTYNNAKHVALGTEEMSIYDIKANNDYRFRVSDVVWLLGSVDGQISSVNNCQSVGQVVSILADGRLLVQWSGGPQSEVYPHEVMLYEENDDQLSEISSSDSTISIDDNDDIDEDIDDDESGKWTDVTDVDSDDETVEARREELIDMMNDSIHPIIAPPDTDDEDNTAPNPWVDIMDGPDDIMEGLIQFDNDASNDEEAHDIPADVDKDKEVISEMASKVDQFDILPTAPTSHKFYNTPPTPSSKSFLSARRRDIKLFSESLPKGVYARSYEDRMDLMSAMLVGPDDTPYRDAMFMFEIFFPRTYPESPPKVHFISMAQRLNPNLYENGTVCVSLLGTWTGHGNENWTRSSSVLQVLLSIQGLILNKEPYYNEAGYESHRETSAGLSRSRWYNEMVVLRMVHHMTTLFKSPPAPFNRDDPQFIALINEFIPRFIERNRRLIKASKDAEGNMEKDLQELAGFPLLTLSEGVIQNLEDKLNSLESDFKKSQS